MIEYDKKEQELNDLISDLFKLRDSFKNRYKSLYKMKGKIYQAKAAKIAYLDVNKLCKKYSS